MKNLHFSKKSVLFFFACILSSIAIQGQEVLSQFQIETDGAIVDFDIDADNDIIYVGGKFDRVGSFKSFLAHVNKLVPFSYLNTPIPNGVVSAFAPDGMGGVYIGGGFTKMDNENRNGLAHIDQDGNLTSWGENIKFDRQILDIEKVGGTIYVGGQFVTINGMEDTAGALLSMEDGTADINYPHIDGSINSSVSDGEGGVFIGGRLLPTVIHGSEYYRNGIAHIDSNGKRDNLFSKYLFNDFVHSVYRKGNILYVAGDFDRIIDENTLFDTGLSRLSEKGIPDINFPKVTGSIETIISDDNGGWYVGGTFTSIGGVTRKNIAHINGSGNVTTWNPSPDNTVKTMSLDGNILYVGGMFLSIGGQSRNYIAAIDLETGVATSWNPSANSQVLKIVHTDTEVISCGLFTFIGDEARRYLASIDKGSGLSTTWNPNPSSVVNTLEISSSRLFVGGSFNSIAGQSRSSLASFELETGDLHDLNTSVSGVVKDLLIDNNSLFVVGNFTSVGGYQRDHVAELNIDSGLPTSWQAPLGADVNTIGIINETVYLGGNFLHINGQSRNYLASLDRTTGLLKSWDPSPGGSVKCIVISNDNIIVGGNFSSIGAMSKNRLAAFDTSTGLPLAWEPYVNYDIREIEISENSAFIVGDFTNVGGKTRIHAAKIDLTTGKVNDWDPNILGGLVRTIEVHENDVFLGGDFSTIGGVSRPFLGSVDKTTGNVTTWIPNSNETVYTFHAHNDLLYLGGNFTNVGGKPRNRLAAFNFSTGNVASWSPDANALVTSILANDTTVLAGGVFTNIGGQNRYRLAELDALVFAGNATNWNPYLYGSTVNSMIWHNNGVFIGGAFDQIGGVSRTHLAAIDEEGNLLDWAPEVTDGTIYSYVSIVKEWNNTLFIAGRFNELDGVLRKNFGSIDLGTGLVTSFDPKPSSRVYDIEFQNSKVYAGGIFSSIGGQSKSYLAELNSTTGAASTWNPSINNYVRSLCSDGSTLYVGGDFSMVGGSLRNSLASFDLGNGSLTTFNPYSNNDIYSLALQGDTLYLGGNFSLLGNNRLVRKGVGAIKIATGDALDWDVGGIASTIIPYQNSVLLAGGDQFGGEFKRTNLMAIDANTGDVLPWNPTTNSDVFKVKKIDGQIFVGGSFTTVNGVSRSRLASVDAITGIESNFNPIANNTVLEIESNGTSLFVGGIFTTIAGVNRNKLAEINLPTGDLLDWNPITTGVNVYDIKFDLDNSYIYIAGRFTNVNGLIRKNLARVNLITRNLDDWMPDIQVSNLFNIELNNNKLYASTGFSDMALVINTIDENLMTLPIVGGKNVTIYENLLYAGGNALDVSTSRLTPWKIPMSPGSQKIHSNKLFAGGTIFASYELSKRDPNLQIDLFETTYNDTFEIPYDTESSGPTLFLSSDTEIVSFSGSEATIHRTGSVAITAIQDEYGSYYGDTTSVALLINKAPLIVTADHTITYGDVDPIYIFNYLGFVKGETSSVLDSEPSGVSISGTAVDVGTYSIGINQDAFDDNYYFSYVNGNLNIEKANLVLTADDQNITYGDLAPTYTFKYSGFVNAESPVVLDIEPSAAELIDPGVDAGTYTIEVKEDGSDNNYTFQYVTGTLTIDKAVLDVFADDYEIIYGENEPMYTYSYGGFVNSETSSVLDSEPSGVSVSNSTVGPAGNYTIEIIEDGNDNNYNFNYLVGTLSVNKAPITVSADAKSKVYGDSDPEFTYQTTSGSLVDGDSFIGDLSRDTGEDAGAYAITQNTLSAGSNYEMAFESNELVINTRALTVSADAKSKVYGDSDPELTYQTTSGSLVDGDSFIGELSRDTGEDVGAYAITQNTLSAGSNYEMAFESNELVINTRSIAVAADSKTKTYGESDPELTYQLTLGSLVNGDLLTGDLSRVIGEDVGAYAIDQNTLSASVNYEMSFESNELSITKKALDVTANDKTKIYNDINPALTISYNGFAFDESSNVIDVEPNVSTAATNSSDVGEYSIVVTGGNDNNYIFNYVNGNLNILKADQVIDFEDFESTINIEEGQFELIATSTSGLPVTFVSSDPTIGFIVGSSVSLLLAGEISIVAEQSGSNNYEPAQSVSKSLTITEVLSATENIGSNLKIYPNPTSDYFAIETTYSYRRAILVNLDGRIVRTFNFNSDQYSVSDLQPGAYLLLVESKDSKYSAQKLIISR